jgi:hypothetical protein
MSVLLNNAKRQAIKDGLYQLSQECIFIFKRMYSHKDLTKSIDDIVDDMDDSELDHALLQTENTLRRYGKL